MALVILQGKVQPEVLEQFRKAQEESEAATFNQFIEIILEKYLNPKVKNIEVFKLPADFEQQQQQLQNEIGRLVTAISLKNDHIFELETRNSQLETRNSEFETVPALEENQEIITLPPVIKMVLDKEAAIAEKKAGKTFTRPDILLNCFWETIVEGRYLPYKIWSGSELAAAAKQIKESNPSQ